MPFFAHEDIISTYRRSLEIVLGQQGWFSFTSVVPHSIQATYLWFISFFTGIEYLESITVHVASINQINSLLFLFKFPYLIAEIVFWYLMISSFKFDNFTRKIMLFNPIVIYSVYMFGRYESFVLLLAVCLLIAIKKNKFIRQAFVFLALLLTRVSMILVIPSFLLLSIKISDKLKFIGVFVVGLLLSIILIPQDSIIGLINWVISGQHTSYLFESRLIISDNFYIPILPVAMVFLFGLGFYFINKYQPKLDNATRFSLGAFVILASYYSLALFHPQYVVWSLPFFFLLLNQFMSSRLKLLAVLSHVVFFLILPFWEGKTTLGLLFPVFESLWFVDLSQPLFLSVAKVGKLLFSITMMLTVSELFIQLKRSSNE